MSHFPQTTQTLMLNHESSFFLEKNDGGLSLYSNSDRKLLFELKEPILLAQGIAEDPNQIHLAYLKETGELCYTIISKTGQHQTTTLGKLDTQNSRYDRLLLLPVDKVIHIFYAASHLALPDVWRITHLLWNGQMWKSAQLGEVVHPRHPLYHVLLDSKSNLHLLMMTFLGNRSILLTNFFNGSYHIWAKRQESLSIPREVIDMAALITPNDTGYLLWGAKQPGSDKFEVDFAIQTNMCDFMSTWKIEPHSINDLNGPWKNFGVIDNHGILSMLINTDQERLFQLKQKSWSLTISHPTKHSALHLIQKAESAINYTEWLLDHEEIYTPLFSSELSLELPERLVLETASTKAPTEPSNSVSVFKSSVVTLPQSPLTSEAAQVSPQQVEAPAPQDEDEENLSGDLLNDIKETTTLLTVDLKLLDEKISGIPESLKTLIQEKSASIPEAIEALALSVHVISEAIESLNQQSLTAQQTLQSLEQKVTDLIQAQQPIKKKGIWQRWLTSLKE